MTLVGPDDILNARILVVDDSAVNVLLLERMLRGAGYLAVTSTTDPCDVRDLYLEHRYDLILLDLLMPVMDGFEVMSDLAEVETEGYLPVLVLTAQPGHKVRALKAGAKDFISKPFDQVEVLTRIHNMLEVRLLLRKSRDYGNLLAHYDPLTGLPNRTLYRDLLAKALDWPDARRGMVSVVFVSIDGFGEVNDALGRDAGDAVLRCVAGRLAECCGPMDVVARIERDEFGMLVVSAGGDPHDAVAVANRVREALRAPLGLEGLAFAVTASVGIAVSPADSADADTLMHFADAALRDAREAGGDGYRFYSAEMNVRAREAIELEHALRHAVERGEFLLHYQPKMRVDTGEWSGVEALIRWDRPGHGPVAPSAFIPVLEATGLIVPVGSWVIQTACRQIAEWEDAGLGWIHVAVNVSARQFLSDGFVPDIARAIRENEIAPEALDIEITESSLMSRREETDDILRELKAIGVRISIDDFGTGYSSLAYLRRFPIDTLKIDISFIRDVTTSPDGAAIVVAIINLARSLKLRVIAEGVETQSQLDFLRGHGCDEIQGFYFSRPLPATELGKLREENRAGSPSLAAAAV